MSPRDFSLLDRPEVLPYLFHPRPTPAFRPPDAGREDFLIPVSHKVRIGASLHLRDAAAPVLLFFHGNGEIVSDYDDLGALFTREAGVNFFVADYRGYGDSEGSPTVAAMLEDAVSILSFVVSLRERRAMTGPLSIMGRSLGSAPALELAAESGHSFHSLILESGFAFAGPLLRVLGLDTDALGFSEGQGMGNLDKMGRVTCPCLVIHGEQDCLIPFGDGRALYDACTCPTRQLLKIKGAGHNDLFIRGTAPYLEAVKNFCS